MGVCNCSMFCCTLLYVHSSIAIILMGKRELVALLNLSSWCLVMVEWLFLAMPWGCLRFVIVVFLIILTYYFCLKISMIALVIICTQNFTDSIGIVMIQATNSHTICYTVIALSILLYILFVVNATKILTTMAKCLQ